MGGMPGHVENFLKKLLAFPPGTPKFLKLPKQVPLPRRVCEAGLLRAWHGMNAIKSSIERREPKDTWSVVVVYEDIATRSRAMSVCDHLVKEFWSDVEFQFRWWRTDFLEDPGMAATATEEAVEADFVIFCASAEAEWAPAVRGWIERWAARRRGREGALVDLTEAGAAPSGGAHRKAGFLRDAARRAAMDYLTKAPGTIAGTLPESFETLALRATQITSVLDDILHHQPPSRFRAGK